MNKEYIIFAELLKLCPRYQFERATERYKGDHLLARCRDLTPKHRFRFKNPSIRSMRPPLICAFGVSLGEVQESQGCHQDALPLWPLGSVAVLSDRHRQQEAWGHHCKGNLLSPVTGQHPVSGRGVISDERISLRGQHTRNKYPQDLRLIKFYDDERQKTLVFLTNNFRLAATTIAQIYKSRWQIELFFKWIKQNLKINRSSEPARMPSWRKYGWLCATYLLLTYIKYQTKYGYSLLHLSRIIRETLFDRKSLVDILTLQPEHLLPWEMRRCRGLYFNRTAVIMSLLKFIDNSVNKIYRQ